MRLSWLSNAPWVGTGYGAQTRLFLPRLRDRLGHAVSCTAFYGLAGSVLGYDGYPVYPRAFDAYGQDVCRAHAEHFGADLLVTLMDAFVQRPDLYGALPWAPWFPIDQEPLPKRVRDVVAKSTQPVVMAKYGQRVAEEAGLDVRYVPHGVDTDVFSPGEKFAARERLGLPTDRYVVGAVLANKGDRKRFPEQLEGFRLFKERHPDALLYLHTHRGPEMQGTDLRALCGAVGLGNDDVKFCSQYRNLAGQYDDAAMATVYRAFDVLLSATAGEGFGVPILEAQACGVPVVTGDWTAMTELTFAGAMVGKEDAHPTYTPLGGWQYLARPAAIADALSLVYRANREHLAAHARLGALDYDADLVTDEFWKPVLDEVAGRIAERKTIAPPTGEERKVSSHALVPA